MVNGQLALHLLPTVVAGLLLLLRRPPSWGRDLAGAGLLLVALAKPTLTAPFMWIAITARNPYGRCCFSGLATSVSPWPALCFNRAVPWASRGSS